MIPIEFSESNVVYAKDQPEYMPLPAYRKPNDPEGLVVTKWQLTPEEIEEISKNGTLYLSVLTFNNPLQPILLTIIKPEL